MRLIDANSIKFRPYYDDYVDYDGYINDLKTWQLDDVLSDRVDNTPTVDAIPVEWIREYICDLEVVISSMRKSHFPNEQAIYNQQFRVFQIKSLLEDWEKENEKDI